MECARGVGADRRLVVADGARRRPLCNIDRVAFVIHIMDELIHHGAEVALLRDLYRVRGSLTG